MNKKEITAFVKKEVKIAVDKQKKQLKGKGITLSRPSRVRPISIEPFNYIEVTRNGQRYAQKVDNMGNVKNEVQLRPGEKINNAIKFQLQSNIYH